MVGAALIAATAAAGSGPWVLGQGHHNLYVGTESQSYTSYRVDGEDRELGDGFSTFGAQAIVGFGLSSRIEAEARVPWCRSRALDTSDDLCSGTRCSPSQGLGAFEIGVKGLLLDEVYGPPVSVSLGLELRQGELTAPTRDRLTNIGEGTVDVGPSLCVGRAAGVGERGVYAISGKLGYRHRQAVDERDGEPVPGAEYIAQAEGVLGTPEFSAGPSVLGLWRPNGVGFDEVDKSDPDWLASLAVSSVLAGGKLLISGDSHYVTLALSGYRSVAASNNPSDLWVVGAGVGFYDAFERR